MAEITFHQKFDCTQRQIVHDIARIIYAARGYSLPNDLNYLYKSQHPTEKSILSASENIFELFWGDSPDYCDEEEE